jgi:hypothetical protein
MKKINEDFVVEQVKKYLLQKGFIVKLKKGVHGADIITDYHKSLRRQYIIEAKGEAGIKKTAVAPIKHNAFYYMIGQILSRMDKEGNKPTRGRVYALAIPKKWTDTFKAKIKKMAFAWKLLKLRIFLVDEKGNVVEKPYTYFLK